MGNVTLTIAGRDLKMTEALVKNRTDGRTWFYFGMAKNAASFGQTIPALAPELPTSVEINGAEVPLTLGKTAASYKDRETKVEVIVPENERRARAAGQHVLEIPGLDEKRDVNVAISMTKHGQWNVKVKVTRAGDSSVSPEAANEKAQKALAALLAG